MVLFMCFRTYQQTSDLLLCYTIFVNFIYVCFVILREFTLPQVNFVEYVPSNEYDKFENSF